jgi:hypothetical protein
VSELGGPTVVRLGPDGVTTAAADGRLAVVDGEIIWDGAP